MSDRDARLKAIRQRAYSSESHKDDLSPAWSTYANDVPFLLAELDALKAREAKLREALTKAAPYSCAECGDHVKVDEDGCCAMCGGDAALAEGEPLR